MTGDTTGKLTKIEIAKLKSKVWQEAKKINNSKGVEAAILFTKNNWNEYFGPIQINQLQVLFENELLKIKPHDINDNSEKKIQDPIKESINMKAEQNLTNEFKLQPVYKRRLVNKTNIWFALISICIILIFSNPTNDDFKNYLQGSFGLKFGEKNNQFEYGRVGYFGVLSVYRCSISIYDRGNNFHYSKTYIGFFKNFIITNF